MIMLKKLAAGLSTLSPELTKVRALPFHELMALPSEQLRALQKSLRAEEGKRYTKKLPYGLSGWLQALKDAESKQEKADLLFKKPPQANNQQSFGEAVNVMNYNNAESIAKHFVGLFQPKGELNQVNEGLKVTVEPSFYRLLVKLRADPDVRELLTGKQLSQFQLLAVQWLKLREVHPNRLRNLQLQKYKVIEQEGVRHIYLAQRKREERCHLVLETQIGFRLGQAPCWIRAEFWTAEAQSLRGLEQAKRSWQHSIITDFNGWFQGNPLVKSALQLV